MEWNYSNQFTILHVSFFSFFFFFRFCLSSIIVLEYVFHVYLKKNKTLCVEKIIKSQKKLWEKIFYFQQAVWFEF